MQTKREEKEIVALSAFRVSGMSFWRVAIVRADGEGVV
jgi:hypothetical protein